MAESVELPSRLGILLLRNKVLLPGYTIRIRCTSASSVKLVEHELCQRESKGLIGILQVRDAAETASEGSVLSPGAASDSGKQVSEVQVGTSDDHKGDGKNQLEVIHWHNRGVAAHALHLSRGVEKPSGRVTHSVVLEGLCRFNVQELSTGGFYYTARIASLEMTKAEVEQVEQDPAFITLSRRFKAAATELISILEQKEETSGMTKVLFQTVPIHKLADIFVATFEISFEGLLSMLNSDYLKRRLSKATELVNWHLQSRHVAEKIPRKVVEQLCFLLLQQVRAIKEELGDNDDDGDDLAAQGRKMQSARMPSNIWSQAQRELRYNFDKATTIKEELGDNDDDEEDLAALEKRMQSARMPSHVWEKGQKKLRRFDDMKPQQPGYNSLRGYLKLLADLPWQNESHDLDLTVANKSLGSDHYCLPMVKQSIIRYLSSRKLKPDARQPILCFVGPSGVGKTSLASSIAAALGRKFVRISLSGVKDEAVIIGSRSKFIESMPGRLINGLKRVGVCNPVMLLDEIDRTCFDAHGVLASVLLEVLDPEQNKSFNDRYLKVPFDLSKVIFVATANEVQSIPPALLALMTVVEIHSYTVEEKVEIAMKHLIPRVLKQYGLGPEDLEIPKAIVEVVIRGYTWEAGVRNLLGKLAILASAAAAFKVAEQEAPDPLDEDVALPLLENRIANGAEVDMVPVPMDIDYHETSNTSRRTAHVVVDCNQLLKLLGPPSFYDNEALERVASLGTSFGLAMTDFGGNVQIVEAITTVGNGKLHQTGLLGDVAKEQTKIALSWVKAKAKDLQLVAEDNINLLEGKDVHVNFPPNAVHKDGPSAGVTVVTALVSLFSRRRVRADTAMTGEITLKGYVWPVGGIKNKVLAAFCYGMKRVILPKKNLKDLNEVPSTVLDILEVIGADKMEDVLNHALEDGSYWRHH